MFRKKCLISTRISNESESVSEQIYTYPFPTPPQSTDNKSELFWVRGGVGRGSTSYLKHFACTILGITG